jgi:DNA modification methylase
MAGDSRALLRTIDHPVHLALTSPPYWTLKEYPAHPGQLGSVAEYETFLDGLDEVWKRLYDLLVPGGRLVIVVGDVLLPRRRNGRHCVMPLHASIQERCRKMGFDNLAPIIWYKIGNAAHEADNGSAGFLGKPYEPNAVIKNDIEYILMQRKGEGYRSPTFAERVASVIPADAHKEWFRQVWDIPGASTRNHPAPFPEPLAERLIRMFSFVGDTVLDPFMGSGTTAVAAASWGRNSIGIEIDPGYHAASVARLEAHGFRRMVPLSIRTS